MIRLYLRRSLLSSGCVWWPPQIAAYTRGGQNRARYNHNGWSTHDFAMHNPAAQTQIVIRIDAIIRLHAINLNPDEFRSPSPSLADHQTILRGADGPANIIRRRKSHASLSRSKPDSWPGRAGRGRVTPIASRAKWWAKPSNSTSCQSRTVNGVSTLVLPVQLSTNLAYKGHRCNRRSDKKIKKKFEK